MPIVDGSGTATGVATVTGLASILHVSSGMISGLGTMTGTGGRLLVFTGQTGGEGELVFNTFVDGEGAASGLATVLGDGQRILVAKGFVFGSSALIFSYPLPIFGQSTLVGNPVVDHVLPAVNAICGPPKCFRFLQALQRGDLPIYISNHGGPVAPVRVVYTLFYVRPDGSLMQVGPGCRKPSPGLVGEFYATGRAGEAGQPGEWIIRWEYQRTFQSAVQVKEMCFSVLDAVAARDPRDVTPRCRKYGWN